MNDPGRQNFDEILHRFAEAWSVGSCPELTDFLPDDSAFTHEMRRALLVELVLADMERRWQIAPPPSGLSTSVEASSSRRLLEDYVRQFPELGSLDTLPWECVEEEIAVRRRAGVLLDHAEYLARFPQFDDELAKLFAVEVTTSLGIPGQKTFPTSIHSEPSDSRLGSYCIIRHLGTGGMGEVYLAEDALLQRRVALKVVKSAVANHRFLREARLLAGIHSPHVVSIYDLQPLPEDQYLLVMEWYEHGDLRQMMKAGHGKIASDVALRYMIQVARGMKAAADLGVVHRDLKPSNILINSRGEAAVADFGIARSAMTGTHTLTTEVLGTPLYMSAEQAEDPRSADVRSDIYSFGAMFYQVLTGTPPFSGESVFAVLMKHKLEPLIPPRTRNPDIPPRLNSIIERCLAKDPADRFQSFDEILFQLEEPNQAVSSWNFEADRELEPYLKKYDRVRDYYLRPFGNYGEHVDFDFGDGRRLRILLGSIIDVPAEAIVCSDDSWLAMTSATSSTIKLAAGSQVEREAALLAPIRPGRVAVTSAGRLPARFVFHCAVNGETSEGFVRPSRDLIAELIAGCFYHAETFNIKEIALPLLATGTAGFPMDVCLDTQFRAIAKRLVRGTTSVEKVTIVIFAREPTRVRTQLTWE